MSKKTLYLRALSFQFSYTLDVYLLFCVLHLSLANQSVYKQSKA